MTDPRLGAKWRETLGKMHELQWISMEIRRLSPVVYVFFGKARETFEFEGFTVPKGWAVLWGHRSSHIRPEIYSEPEEFDPSRFSPSRAEHLRHEHAFVPNGYEFAPLFLQVFLVELYRAFDVVIAQPQDVGLDWSRVPSEPGEGLRASVKRRWGVRGTPRSSAKIIEIGHTPAMPSRKTPCHPEERSDEGSRSLKRNAEILRLELRMTEVRRRDDSLYLPAD
jgi:hypothetical protein